MLLAPAHIPVMGGRPSSSRSAEISMVVSAPRCTPPMPPVANTRMPAMAASIMVPATVVAPSKPRAATRGKSLRLVFTAFCPAWA